MKTSAITMLALSIVGFDSANAQESVAIYAQAIQAVAPALDRYTSTTLLGGVWKRPGLSMRDRSIVTVAILIARNQTTELPFYLNVALDNGVKPAELSEIFTHLAFYAGWGNAMAAVVAAADVFKQRGIGADQLPSATPDLMSLDQATEDQRAAAVQANVGPASQSLVDYTGSALFHDLWLRPDLAPRDRSLVTVSALIANGQGMQITYHLNRAMDNGLTEAEAAEVLTQSAFYAGWPNAMSAVPVFKEIFAKRAG
ncbi:carboxymuconolactone decarboxylase family protein [Rhizobium sp. ZPR3]|uniref:Carboxymuconolactone decarboxylase family protein n=2 Tax=unclassified Rhizobium TaxID=2613769 RepID=A0AAU7SIP1_9HYPH